MLEQEVSCETLGRDVGVAAGTISNWREGKREVLESLTVRPWEVKLELVKKLEKQLQLPIGFLIASVEMQKRPYVFHCPYFDRDSSSTPERRLGSLSGRWQFEMLLDHDANYRLRNSLPGVQREWNPEPVVGELEQIGDHLSFHMDGYPVDGQPVEWTFRGQLLEHGLQIAGTYQMKCENRFIYGFVMARRESDSLIEGRWLGRNSSFGGLPIGGDLRAKRVSKDEPR